jgi:hypothetical protein
VNYLHVILMPERMFKMKGYGVEENFKAVLIPSIVG